MTNYYLSRMIISIVLGGLFALLGAQWWMAVLAGLLALAVFFYAPLSGRYTVQPDKGLTPLRRDEFSKSVTNKAGRNAFAFMMIALAGIVVYSLLSTHTVLTATALSVVLALGVIVFFVSDYWMRRM
jgi:hypothetical protein